MARQRNGQAAALRVHVEAEALDVREGEQHPALAAYAFGSSGRLLAQADLKPGAGVLLSIPQGAEPDEVRLLVGLQSETKDEGELLSHLIRVGAAERMLRPADLDANAKLHVPIDRSRWWCWLRGLCVVPGTLVKRVVSGGVSIELPVCGAEIEVYEVDPVPVIVHRIPDAILDRLRDVILRPRPPWPPWPPEDPFGGIVPRPGPGPDPAPFLAVERAGEAPFALQSHALAGDPSSSADAVSAGVLAEGEGERLFRFAGAEVRGPDPGEARAALHAVAEEPALQRAAFAGTAALREALVARPELVRPLLCFLWPPAVTTQLVARATTDDCGHFRAIFSRGCSSDVPDLYFKAFRRLGFWRVPIYEPTPIACHTRWNYACGTEVQLVTTSPWAHTCPPCPPVIAPRHWVLAMAVGNTSLASIRGTSTALAPTTNGGNIGLTGTGAPWGGSLHLRFEFDNTLRTDLNVRYYRLRWRKAGSGNPFVDIATTELRHYGHWLGSAFQIEPYKLGPQPVGGTANLYEIPPALPPIGQWVIADAVVDTSSGTFLSASFAPPAEAGLYEFELALFDGAGAAVNATTAGISFRIPETTDLTATIPTADAAALGLVAAGRLFFTLHVDNNACSASIGAPLLNGGAADACGVLHWGSSADVVSLPFAASHPNGFATFSFGVRRGVTDVLTDSGAVGAPPGSHLLTPTAGALLGNCPIAGFAEWLDVDALATDGWSRLSGYDADDLRAFVLAPEEPS